MRVGPIEVGALELLLFQRLLRKSVDRQELRVLASDGTPWLIMKRILVNPLRDALSTEGCLAFLALLRIQDDFKANLTNIVCFELISHCIARTQVNLVAAIQVVRGAVRSFEHQVLNRLRPPLVDMDLLIDVLEHLLLASLRPFAFLLAPLDWLLTSFHFKLVYNNN